ncbi:MAG: hypothetical protein WC382_02815 [Methanoregulaceae archaeon]|jgi:HSP20 family protein
MDDDRKEEDESIVEGTLDDLVPGIGRVVKRLRKTSPEFDRKIEEKDAEIKKRLEEGYSPEPKVQYGIRVRTLAPGGREKKEARPERETVEPEMDIFDEGNYLRIVTELPGVSEEKIKIDLEQTTLIISASERGRDYRKRVSLPCEVTLGKKKYQNGILELILEKTDA